MLSGKGELERVRRAIWDIWVLDVLVLGKAAVAIGYKPPGPVALDIGYSFACRLSARWYPMNW